MRAFALLHFVSRTAGFGLHRDGLGFTADPQLINAGARVFSADAFNGLVSA